MNKQITDTILMIRPVKFHGNEETVENNYYQKTIKGLTRSQIQIKAETEFDGLVDKLKSKRINVIVVNDTEQPVTPDSIFPNNWISFHNDGDVMLYPMFAKNRRVERRIDIINQLRDSFIVNTVEDLSNWELEDKFLEGTGSMILDRINHIAYAVISDRTHQEVLIDFCKRKKYKPVSFHSLQTVGKERLPIYHTNVMMCLGEEFAVICLAAIDDENERSIVSKSLIENRKEIIEIDESQNGNFAGNMLQVSNSSKQRYIAMSDTAFKCLHSDQIEKLEKHGEIIHSNLNTIETLGGGSARCMMAEIFLPRK
ncbi:MAG: arginine deiminase-related protein [Bacteroidetes bacterium]|nr:arginine deiminase-related protein [Bacteroidota bacterium]MDA1122555.1 arginine deiminase-related protein [Bacteroidota bacterium]